jgi:hypothetical protein
LYPAVEKFLANNKNCLSEYVGTQLVLKKGEKSFRVEVFGVSNEGEKLIYLCEREREN